MRKAISVFTICSLMFVAGTANAGPGAAVKVWGSGYTYSEAYSNAYSAAQSICASQGSYVDSFEVTGESQGAQWIVRAIAFCA